ncbi:MAG: transposase, partial [Deltaproteobacteria bacterium]|nr:transposase [Deltaproteobacteria bacterium]
MHHVISRGNGKQKIFLDDHDRMVFMEKLVRTITRESWICHAYCLLENHYHLLVELTEPNLHKGMQFLNGSYCQWFNFKHNRVGHTMQGRYKSPMPKNDGHLLEIVRYVVLNPVASGLTGEPEDWRWSSYRATAGLCPCPSFLRIDFVISLFETNGCHGREGYIQWVEDGKASASVVPPGGTRQLDDLPWNKSDKAIRNK